MKRIDLPTAAQRLTHCSAARILMHSHPDGDTLGSGYALAHALRALGKDVVLQCKDGVPAMFSYMSEGLQQRAGEDPLVVSVDVAAPHLLGEDLRRYPQHLSIDHHQSNALFADETLLDVTAAATTEIISDLIDLMQVPMTTQMAACLYAGLSTDTGCFRYANTTARSHRCAARYIDLGVETEPLDRRFFETDSKSYLALERLAMDSLRYFCEGRVALIAVTQKMFNQSGSNDEEYVKLVARSRQIEGVLVGVTIRERAEGDYKISLRSHAPVDAAAIAAKLGGGGHARAAACASKLPLEEAIAAVVGCVGDALSFSEEKETKRL